MGNGRTCGSKGWAAVCAALMCGGLLVNAPQACGQTSGGISIPTLNVTSRLVVLDVQVVDSKGNVVTGLDKSQFTVYEDKTVQRIRDFESPQQHAMPKPGELLVNSTADLAKIGNAPVNVIVIDELNTAFSDTARAQQAIRKFLEGQPAVLPVPTLFLASGASHVAVLHDFTQSRAALLESMKTHVTDIDMRALANQLNGGTMAAEDGFAKTLGALSQVASSLRGIPGRKNVIWVGTGFDNAYDLTSASQLDADAIQTALQLVTRRMLEARMTVSTLDPAGIDSLEPVEDSADEAVLGGGPNSTTDFGESASFDGLALSTGGTVVHGRNDLDHLIANDAGRASDFYTLTYSPSNHSDAAQAYRNIRVVMKDPTMHAITRTGYFAGPATEPPVVASNSKLQSREFKFDLTSAAASQLIYTGLTVSAVKENYGDHVLVQARDLDFKTQDDGTRLAEVSIVGVAFNAKGKLLLQSADEFKERIHSNDSVTNAQVGFRFAWAVPPTATRVRFVVRDASNGNIGSVDLKP